MPREPSSAQRQHQDTLDSIYEAAFDPCAFDALAGVVAQANQSTNGVVIIRHGGVPAELSATTSEQARNDYLLHYGKLDIWTPTIARAAPLEVAASHELIADRDVLNSEFYVDYARHLDMWHPMGTSCALTPDLNVALGINRARGAEQFDEADKAQFISLARHVQRALQLRRHVQSLERRANLGFAILDQLAFGVIVADAESRLVYVNAPAEDLSRRQMAFVLRRGRVSIALQHQARSFEGLVRSAATGGSGGAMQIADRNGTVALLALITPMPRRLRQNADTQGLVLIALRPAADSPAFCDTVVAQIYGLSRSETQVLRALAAGNSSDEIAAARGVKFTTIKSQLEAVIRKTGTKNQRDLVRLLGTMPQIR